MTIALAIITKLIVIEIPKIKFIKIITPFKKEHIYYALLNFFKMKLPAFIPIGSKIRICPIGLASKVVTKSIPIPTKPLIIAPAFVKTSATVEIAVVLVSKVMSILLSH